MDGFVPHDLTGFECSPHAEMSRRISLPRVATSALLVDPEVYDQALSARQNHVDADDADRLVADFRFLGMGGHPHFEAVGLAPWLQSDWVHPVDPVAQMLAATMFEMSLPNRFLNRVVVADGDCVVAVRPLETDLPHSRCFFPHGVPLSVDDGRVVDENCLELPTITMVFGGAQQATRVEV